MKYLDTFKMDEVKWFFLMADSYQENLKVILQLH